jgi:hypothetical protein
LTRLELALIDNAMAELGFRRPIPERLLEMYQTKTGLLKMVAESVMSIDPQRFQEFQLIQYVVSSRRSFMSNLDDILQIMAENADCVAEAATLFSRFFFPLLPISLMEQFEIPPGVPAFEKLIPSQIEVSPLTKASVNAEIVEKLVVF